MRPIGGDKLIVSFRTTKKLAEMIGNDVGVATWDTAEALLEDAPTIDAVSVVRCQNCRHWNQHTAVDSNRNLVYLASGCCGPRKTNKDDYCSFAVRREDNGK